MADAPEPADQVDGEESTGTTARAATAEATAGNRVPPAAAGYTFRESLGFRKDASHARWIPETDDQAEEQASDEEIEGETAEQRNAPDDEENPGNLGPLVRGYDDAPQIPIIEGSPFLTPTVPLELKRAIFTNDLAAVRGFINGWNSSATTGNSEADTIARKLATALFDETSKDTLLHVAVLKRYAELARYLVSQGARLAARNAKQMSPLSIAKMLEANLAGWADYPLAIRLDGHPDPTVNGIFTQRGECGGFPRCA